MEIGYVSRIEGDSAYVTLAEKEACSDCGANIICKSDSTGGRELKVSNSLGAKVGNEVEISESGIFLFKLSALQYGLPFVGFIACILLAHFFLPPYPGIAVELLLFGSGLLGIVTGGFAGWLWAKQMAGDTAFTFSIDKILS